MDDILIFHRNAMKLRSMTVPILLMRKPRHTKVREWWSQDLNSGSCAPGDFSPCMITIPTSPVIELLGDYIRRWVLEHILNHKLFVLEMLSKELKLKL